MEEILAQVAAWLLLAAKYDLVNAATVGFISFVLCLALAYWMEKNRRKHLLPIEQIALPRYAKTYRLGQKIKGYEVVRIEKVADHYYRVWSKPLDYVSLTTTRKGPKK